MKNHFAPFAWQRSLSVLAALAVLVTVIATSADALPGWLRRKAEAKAATSAPAVWRAGKKAPATNTTFAPWQSWHWSNGKAAFGNAFEAFDFRQVTTLFEPLPFGPAAAQVACTTPTLSYALAAPNNPRVINVGESTAIDPTNGPSDTTSIALASSTGYTGGIAVNSSTGRVSIINAAPAGGTYTISITATNNNIPSSCTPTATTNASFQLRVNGAPAISPSAVTRVAGGSTTPAESLNVTIATVSDDFDTAGSLPMSVNGGASATVNGVTVSNLSNSNGTVTADVAAACGASTATFTLTTVDSNGLTKANSLTVTVTANPAPVAPTYNTTTYVVNQGGNLTINPTAAPSDNVSYTVSTGSLGGYNGNISVNSMGVISLSNAGPGGATPTISISVTDNCNVTSTSSVKVKINGPPTLSTNTPTVRQGSGAVNQTIANISDPEDPVSALMFAVTTTSPNNGVTISNVTVNTSTGEVKADVSASCSATAASFTVTATDSTMLSSTGTVNVTVQSNTAPTLSYPSTVTVNAGAASTVIAPIAAPTDNGTISSLALVTPVPTACGTLSINTTAGADYGKITVTNAPSTQQSCSVTVRATDNCSSVTNATLTINISAPNVSFNKTHAGTSVQPGETVAWQLNFANSGTQDATGAQITETVPVNTTFSTSGSSTGWSCTNGAPAGTTCTYTVGNIGAGGSGQVFFATTVNNPIGIGAQFNSVTNTATYTDSVSGTKSAMDTIAIAALPDLSLAKTDNGAIAGAGQLIEYFVSYSNVGRRNAAGVVVTETVPANTTFNAAASLPTVWSCADGSLAGTTCTVTVGNVTGSGGAGTLKFAVNVVPTLPNGVTQITNTASVIEGSGTDPVSSNNTAVDTTPVGPGPVITPAVVPRTAGSPVSNLEIAMVTDNVAPAANVVVVATSLPAGISVTNITNLNGTIYANVRADCNAATGNNFVTLQGTDTLGNITSSALLVNVTANTTPAQGTYSTTTVNLSANTTVTPSVTPTDNGSIVSIVASAPGFTGTFSANAATGVINIGNAGPAGSYNVIVTATDNCGAASTRTFTLLVNGAPGITPASSLSMQQGTAATGATIASVTDDLTPLGSLAVVRTFAPTGITVTGIANSGGTITANIAAACSATIGANVVGLQVTDGSGLTTTANLTITVTANTAPTLGTYAATSLASTTGTTVTPSAPPSDNGTVVSLTASAPGFAGSLTTNVVSGAVTIANAGPLGTYTVTLTATDNCGASTSTMFQLTVTCPTITVTPPVITAGTVGSLFSQVFTQTGGIGNVNFTLQSGTLPTGMSLALSGALSGVPTQSGSFPLTIKATDVNGCTGVSATYTLVINCQTITVNAPGVTTGTTGVPFSQNFTQVGGLGTTNFTVNSGNLPPGMVLNLNGQLAGTPTQQGAYSFTVLATDANGCTGVSASYTLTISCPTISMLPSSLPNGTYGVAYSQTVTASPAGAYSYTVPVGALPAGLSLNPATGEITGTPTAVGTATFTVRALYYTNCPFDMPYTIIIQCPTVTLAPVNLATGTIGSAYSQTVTGNPASAYSYAVTAGALPNGVTLNANTGLLSGTPTLVGTFNFTITATGLGGVSACTGSQAYTVIINCRTVTFLPPTTLPGGQTGQSYSQPIIPSPSGSYNFTVANGTLPPGLTLNPATGVVSGTPTLSGTFNFSVKATDVDGCSGTQAFSLTIGCPLISLAPGGLPTGTLGVAYAATTFAATPTNTYNYSVTGGSLPAGVTLTSAGVLSGTPTQAGNFTVTITATDAQLCTGSRTYSLAVNVCQSVTLSPASLPSGVMSTAYQQVITASGGVGPYTFARTGASPLPAGLTLSQTGVLSGNPTTPGSFSFTVTATDANGCTGSRNYTVSILSCSVSAVTPVSLTIKGKSGTYSFAVTSSGCSWTAVSQAPWLTVTANGSGAGNATVSYTATVNTTGVTRIGTIIVNNLVYTVTQIPHYATTAGVFRPTNGNLYLKNQNTTGFADLELVYGMAGDFPVTGDWNADGIDTIGIYRNGTFYLRNSNTTGFADLVVSFGAAGDQPVVGDWNGDGIDTIGVYRNGAFYLRNSLSSGPPDLVIFVGTAGDIGIAGDWNGDGIDTVGVFRPTNGNLYLRNTNTTGVADLTLVYCFPGDQPIIGDWDGDGTDTIGIKRGQVFHLRNSNTSGVADITFTLGLATDVPIAGDWNGLP